MTLTQRLSEYVRACLTALWIESHEHDDWACIHVSKSQANADR